mmetsp:Transcript_12542/g.25378  ORF Transcript_12542/g.25378 Transcript_12542/m.25378 type:complete len:85 (+) Transcript_12542:774-1028(+)
MPHGRGSEGSEVPVGSYVGSIQVEMAMSQVKPLQQCSSKLQPLTPSSRQHLPYAVVTFSQIIFPQQLGTATLQNCPFLMQASCL